MKFGERINNLLASGKTSFSIDDAKQINGLTEVAVKHSLAKLTAKETSCLYKEYDIGFAQ